MQENAVQEADINILTGSYTPYQSDITEFCKDLHNHSITKIISYDDEWFEEEMQQDLGDWLQKPHQEFTEHFGIQNQLNLEEFDDLLFECETVQDVLDSEEERLRPLITEYQRILYKKIENPILQALEEFLQDVKGREEVCIEKKNKCFVSADAESDDRNILFLVDRDMSKTDGTEDEITPILSKIHQRRKDHFDLIIVYTNDMEEHFKTHEGKIQYLNEQYKKKLATGEMNEENIYLLAHQLWVFKKVSDKETLSKELLKILSDAAFGHSLHDYLQEKIMHSKEAMLELLKIPNTIYKCLYEEAFIEGCMFTDAIDELQKSIIGKLEFEKLKEEPYKTVIKNVNKVARRKNEKTLKEIMGIIPNNGTERKKGRIKIYRGNLAKQKLEGSLYKDLAEHSLVDYSMNSKYRDIRIGDIFRVKFKNHEKFKYGVLITQECDLVVRFTDKEPDKIGRNASKAMLLLGEYKKIESVEDYNELTDKIWPIIHNGEIYCINFSGKSDTVELDIKLLDLSSLNSNGKASLQLQKEYKEYKTYYFDKYVEEEVIPWIKGEVELSNYPELKQLISTPEMQESIAKKSTIQNNLLKLAKELKYNIEYNETEQEFQIQRIGCLEKNHTLSLIHNKQHQATRIGYNKPPLIS